MIRAHTAPRFSSRLQRWLLVEPGEEVALFWAIAYFFCLLLSYYLVRPVREAFGLAGGADKLPWLMTGTLFCMLGLNPIFALLVSRYPRRRFIPIVYRFFSVHMGAFFVLGLLLPNHGGKWLGYAFYIWLSVFNLFVVSLFWGLISESYTEQQATRLFGIIAVGGTIGAIFGSAIATLLTRQSQTIAAHPFLLLLPSAATLELGVQCMRKFSTLLEVKPAPHREPGPNPLEGLRLIWRSRWLQIICAYMLFFSISSTLLYLEQGAIIAKAFRDTSSRTAAFAQIDLGVNTLTLLTQLLLTGRWVSRFGITAMLLTMPALTAIGFGTLWAVPVFAVLAVFQTLRRGLHYSVDRPVREMLFVPVSADVRYKSKPLIDTFVFRCGDFIGVWLPTALSALTIPTAPLSTALAVVWIGVAIWLGRVRNVG